MTYRIGIDLGGTNIKVGIVNTENQIVAVHSQPTLVHREWQEIVHDMVQAVYIAAEKAGVMVAQCISCGVGSPGIVDAKTGDIVYANNFGWMNIPLGKTLCELLNMPVSVSNDANCAALGECVGGAAKDVQDMVMITLGTGVGGGVVMNGKILESAPGGMELGHMVIVDDGEPCTCGRVGCFETCCSATALIRAATNAAKEHPESTMNVLVKQFSNVMNGLVPFEAAKEGDAVAQAVIDRYINLLARGVVNIVNIFHPEVILLSGGVCAQGEYLTKPLLENVQKYSYGSKYVSIPHVKIASLANNAGILGAANLQSICESK